MNVQSTFIGDESPQWLTGHAGLGSTLSGNGCL